jgi:hypothetical protein
MRTLLEWLAGRCSARTEAGLSVSTHASTLNPASAANFCARASAPPYGTGSGFSQRRGLRRGEVLGLRWSDVDFDLGQLAVANTITEVGVDEPIRRTQVSLLQCRHLVSGS